VVVRDAEVATIEVADATDSINYSGLTLGANDTLDSAGSAAFDTVTVSCLEANEWYTVAQHGTPWTDGGTPIPTPTSTPTPAPTVSPTPDPNDYTADANCQGAWLVDGATEAGAVNNACDGETDDGTWFGTWTAGVTDPDGGENAADFDGSTDFVNVLDAAKYDGLEITYGCWATRATTNSDTLFYHGTGGWDMRSQSSGRAQTYYSSTHELTDSGDFDETDGWVHIVMTHQDDANDYLELFVDGVADCSGSCSADVGPASSAVDVTIGGQGSIDLFTGQLYECFMFDRYMTSYEICHICRFGLDAKAPDRAVQCNTCDYTP